MIRSKKWIPAVLAVLLALGLLAGCSGTVKSQTAAAEAPAGDMMLYADYEATATAPAAPMPMPEPYVEEEAYDSVAERGTSGGAMQGVSEAAALQQKLIKDVWLEGETSHFDEALTAITDAVLANGGYIQSSSVNGRKPEAYGDSGRSASIEARVPAGGLDAFLFSAKGAIDVYNEDARIQNVTSQYYDTQSRKETYEIQLERLEAILTEAAELSDIITLESEIARVRYEIEALETTLRNLDNRVSYSTVTIHFYELTEFQKPVATEQSLGERIGSALTQSVYDIGNWFENAIVWIFARWLLILVLIALVVVAVILIRKAVKKHKAAAAAPVPAHKPAEEPAPDTQPDQKEE